MSELGKLEEAAKAELQTLIAAGVDEAKTDLVAAVREEVAKYLPELVKAVVSASAQAAIQLAKTGEQKLTALIPGQLDNEILDPIVSTVLNDFSHLFQ